MMSPRSSSGRCGFGCRSGATTDLAKLLKPMEQARVYSAECEILALTDLQVLDLPLLRLHLLSQWLDDGIGQDVAGLGGDLRRVLAT